MDRNALRRLAGIDTIHPSKDLHEEKWSADVTTKKHPPEGLFASGSVKSIVSWLQSNHSELKGAMSALNFYINRSGKNLTASRKAELESAKNALRKAYGVKESFDLELIRKFAGINKPVAEESDENSEESTEGEDSEEAPSAEDTQPELPELVKQLAIKAEGKSAEELEEILNQLYQAGFEDGKDSLETSEEMPAEEDEESDEPAAD